MWWQTSNCSPLLIYRPWEDESLSWLGWLTYSGRLTNISGHPSATGRAQDGERTLARDWRSSTEPRGPITGQCVICQVNMRCWRQEVSVCRQKCKHLFLPHKNKRTKQCSILKRKLSKTYSVHHYHRNCLLCRSNFTCVIQTVKSCIALNFLLIFHTFFAITLSNLIQIL